MAQKVFFFGSNYINKLALDQVMAWTQMSDNLSTVPMLTMYFHVIWFHAPRGQLDNKLSRVQLKASC